MLNWDDISLFRKANLDIISAVIGAEVADKLFEEGINPLDKEVLVDNVKVKIVGVLKREGQDILGFNFDKAFLIPYELVNKTMSIELYMADPTIFILPRENVDVEEMMTEVEGLMRNQRRLRPKDDENFALVRFSLITNSFGSMLGALNIAGWIIGLFALLVGGFGIANIMYVKCYRANQYHWDQKGHGSKEGLYPF